MGSSSQRQIEAPIAQRQGEPTQKFGIELLDPYGWLRDQDWQRVMRDPSALANEIRSYLDAENKWAQQALEPVEELRETLTNELRSRIKEEDSTVPTKDGPWSYFRKFTPGGQYPIFCRIASERDKEQILLDGNLEAEGEAFFSVHGAHHSPDHRYFCAAIDRNGSEYCRIEIRETATGRIIDSNIKNAQGDLVFSADSQFIFYTWLDDNHRPAKVFLHAIGSTQDQDTLIFEENDPGFFLSVSKSASGRYVIINSHDHADTTEVLSVPAEAPKTPPDLLWPRQHGVSCNIADYGDKFFVLTNEGNDFDFRISETHSEDLRQGHWTTVVPHVEGRLIRSMLLFKNFLVRLERENATPRIVIINLSENREYEIDFDEDAYDLNLIPGLEFDTSTLRYSYSSPTTPTRIFDFDMETGERQLRKEQEIPSGHSPDNYICARLTANSSDDGAIVPVTVIHRKDIELDGSAPLLLYGYGSYGYSMPANFSPNIFSLVDRGFVYAIAHVRGGTECGKKWHLAGKLRSKINTFVDFIAAAEMLVSKKYSSKGNIVAQGRSAGGMLMGAVANMRPDLFKGIIAEVPFVDVINTMSDETLPLTPPEWVEWGDPIRDQEAFKYMASYCPYTNVSDREYPNILATGGLTDPRVTYWEPAKWVAKLRHHNKANSKIILWINMDAGHGGASGRFERLSEVALSYAFALMISDKTDN